MLTALIADDEPLARAYLRRMLEAQDVTVADEAENGIEAMQRAEDLRPDLIFLDIQMPGLTGMQVASALIQLEHSPRIIFVTGYSEHAVTAFEHDALDYLVKPVSPDRLAKTLERARTHLSDSASREQTQERITERLREAPPLRRLPVREDYTVRLIRIEDLLCAAARDKRVYLRTAAGEYRSYYTLSQLETLLPPEQFVRIHDSYLIPLARIEALDFLGNHSYSVRLSDGSHLPVGRTRYTELRRRLGLNNNSTM